MAKGAKFDPNRNKNVNDHLLSLDPVLTKFQTASASFPNTVLALKSYQQQAFLSLSYNDNKRFVCRDRKFRLRRKQSKRYKSRSSKQKKVRCRFVD
jgi:hypothetical protein